MTWDSEKIKDLRLRLGWSVSDLARRLNCESRCVLSWEKGESNPEPSHAQNLELISHQAEASSEELTNLSLADKIFEETDLNQCDLNLIKDKYLD